MPKIKAVLFDLDGVLVDACEWHFLALNSALRKHARFELTREEHEITFNAMSTRRKLDLLVGQGRLDPSLIQAIFDLKQALTKDTILANARPCPEKTALHEVLRDLGVASACVTNSITETAELSLRTTDQLRFMRFVMSNEMVRNTKPHPEGYIRSMIRLQAMPDECLIVEDSEKGIKAAEATGAEILKVGGARDVTKDAVLGRLVRS